MGVHCCCLHVNYIVYKHFDRSMHIGSSDSIYLCAKFQVFEILGSKMKYENDDNKKNWRNGLFAISYKYSGSLLFHCASALAEF